MAVIINDLEVVVEPSSETVNPEGDQPPTASEQRRQSETLSPKDLEAISRHIRERAERVRAH